MNVNGVSTSGYTPLPVFKDMAAVLAARPALVEMQNKAGAQAVAKADDAVDATRSASTVNGGTLDVYL